jgi:hypothetical protein
LHKLCRGGNVFCSRVVPHKTTDITNDDASTGIPIFG